MGSATRKWISAPSSSGGSSRLPYLPPAEYVQHPLPKGRQPTTIAQEGKSLSTTLPLRAVCTSCHDTAAAGGHAELNTTATALETCEVCHGPNAEFAATAVHK